MLKDPGPRLSDERLSRGCPAVAAGIVCHNRPSFVPEIVAALVEQGIAPEAIRVVDVASGADFGPIVARCPEGVILEHLTGNVGPNPARNRIVEGASKEFVLLLDDDCLPTPGCIEALLAFASEHPDAGFLSPCFVHAADPHRVQLEGADFHPVGDAVWYHSDENLPGVPRPPRRVGIGPGTCLMVRRSAWEQVGGFDPDYFFGRTDSEFLHRLGIAGWSGYVVPAAICTHDVKERGLSKAFWQVRNRLIFLLTCYRLRTLILMLPSLLLHEAGILALLAVKGRAREWVRAVGAVAGALPSVLAKRRRIQRTRIVPDSALLRLGPIQLRGEIENRPVMLALKRLLEGFYAVNWWLVRRLV